MKKKSPTHFTPIHPIWVSILAVLLTLLFLTHQVGAEDSFFQSPPAQPAQVAPTPAPAPITPTETITLPTTTPPLSPTIAITATTTVTKITPPTIEPEVTPTKSAEPERIFDQAEFIDTVVIFFSWIWLCCGIALFLTVPLVMLLLQIRGGVKLNRQRKKARDN
jgi:hypothetical protein